MKKRGIYFSEEWHRFLNNLFQKIQPHCYTLINSGSSHILYNTIYQQYLQDLPSNYQMNILHGKNGHFQLKPLSKAPLINTQIQINSATCYCLNYLGLKHYYKHLQTMLENNQGHILLKVQVQQCNRYSKTLINSFQLFLSCLKEQIPPTSFLNLEAN